MTTIEIDDTYALGLIKAALGNSNSNSSIERSNIKRHIINKVKKLKDYYGLAHSEIFSEISFNFIRRSILYRKFDFDKGSITTFILHYVFNELRNIEDKCRRGTFMKENQNHDAMDIIIEDIFDYILEDIKEGVEFDNPENILLAKETYESMKEYFSQEEMNDLLNGNNNYKLSKKIKLFKEANIIK